MIEPTDIAPARYEAAKNSYGVTPRELLVEIIRQIDAGEIKPTKVALIIEYDVSEGTISHILFHSKVTKNEGYILASHLKAAAWEDLTK